MLGTVLRACITHRDIKIPFIIIPILQMKQLAHRDIKQLAQGHTELESGQPKI